MQDLSALNDLALAAQAEHTKKLTWNPPFSGAIDMRIDRQGRWFYQSGEIKRAPMVRLFASILRREADTYYLVTPVEKVSIQVDDAPFISSELTVEGHGLGQKVKLTTNVGDSFYLSAEHPLRLVVEHATSEPRPYALVRQNLETLIARTHFYELVALCQAKESHGEQQFGFYSCDHFFPLA